MYMSDRHSALDTATDERFDPVTLEILWSRLIGISEEMWTTVWRTAFSTIVALVQDHGCELLDRDGGCLAHAPSSMPAFNLTMPNVARQVLAKYPAETMREGDVYITNDPWICAGHLPDICVLTPIFYQGEMVGFAGTVAHAIDIGGTLHERKATELYEEGILIPIMKLYDAGVRNDTLVAMIAANVRNPAEVIGDIEAEITANEVGVNRVTMLLAEYGLTDLHALSRVIEGRTENATRAAIAAIPDGTYRATIPYDGLDTPLEIVVALTVVGDELTVDFTGTSGEVGRAGMNAPLVYSKAHTCYALMCILTPNVPNNEGCFRPVTVVAPEGCILNCRFPATVNSRTRSGWHIAPAIYAALAEALPEKVMAGCGLLQSFRTRGVERDGRAFNVPSFSGAGQGASFGRDGMPGYIFPSTSSGMAVELFEMKAPAFIRSKRLLSDSGGAGQYRGGLGQRIVIGKLPGYEAPLPIYMHPDLMVCPPPGLLGGKDGCAARVTFNGALQGAGSSFDREGMMDLVEASDEIIFDLPGGGGYGDPATRAPEAIQRDLALGYVTPEGVTRDYGIDPAARG